MVIHHKWNNGLQFSPATLGISVPPVASVIAEELASLAHQAKIIFCVGEMFGYLALSSLFIVPSVHRRYLLLILFKRVKLDSELVT